jgi:DMSO/TMAO reductase YedYZ molybdopterin-dependent catalytic subunit
MSKTDSITLWRNRIQSRKLSGLKVNDWCKQNSISRYAYYYWFRKLKDTREEQDDVFVEVSLEQEPTLPVEKVERPEILIAWKDFSISVTDQHAIPMAAELLSRLGKQC